MVKEDAADLGCRTNAVVDAIGLEEPDRSRAERERKVSVRRFVWELGTALAKGRARLNEHPGERLLGSVGNELWNVDTGQSLSMRKSLQSGNWCRTQNEERTVIRRKGRMRDGKKLRKWGKSS